MISGDVSVSRERTFREIPRWIWEMKCLVISKAALEAKEEAEFRGKGLPGPARAATPHSQGLSVNGNGVIGEV